ELGLDFSILVSRKLPIPDNPEAGFGAVAEDGSLFIIEDVSRWIPEDMIGKIVEEQKRVILKRISDLRQNRRFPEIVGRTVILTDDGIAMGSTMRAAVEMCRNKKAGRIVVAVPVSGTSTAKEIAGLVDEMIVLETPPNFRAVAQAYRNWHDVTDQEVMDYIGEA
ncbi:MAG: phosphoribosyltransferase, partial [Calditrichaeota bacterium]